MNRHDILHPCLEFDIQASNKHGSLSIVWIPCLGTKQPHVVNIIVHTFLRLLPAKVQPSHESSLGFSKSGSRHLS